MSYSKDIHDIFLPKSHKSSHPKSKQRCMAPKHACGQRIHSVVLLFVSSTLPYVDHQTLLLKPCSKVKLILTPFTLNVITTLSTICFFSNLWSRFQTSIWKHSLLFSLVQPQYVGKFDIEFTELTIKLLVYNIYFIETIFNSNVS